MSTNFSSYLHKKQSFREILNYHILPQSTDLHDGNVSYRERKIDATKTRYSKYFLYKEKLKALSKEKYKNDLFHKDKVKALNKHRYKFNEKHRQKKKEISKRKYNIDTEHKSFLTCKIISKSNVRK